MVGVAIAVHGLAPGCRVGAAAANVRKLYRHGPIANDPQPAYNRRVKLGCSKGGRMRALGADISVHQSTFSFQGNLDFVILRASVGTAADARFQQFLPEAMQVSV